MRDTQPVVVLGAGLTGCSVALELAARGVPVTLVERFTHPMLGAAATNEGKIHLGYIYAADTSFRTAELMLRGGMTFLALLRRWCGEDTTHQLGVSKPFIYLVDRESLLSPNVLAEHYARVDARFQALIEDFPGLDYLGHKALPAARRLTKQEAARWFICRDREAAFATGELAIDPLAMAHRIRTALRSNPLITLETGCDVRALESSASGYRIEAVRDNQTVSLSAPTVVNCLWENRLFFDQAMGLELPAKPLHRLKYRAVCAVPATLREAPSATRVLGGYGDVVVWPSGQAYLSWYPEGMRGWSEALKPPSEWQGPMLGDVPMTDAQEIGRRIRAGIAPWFPEVAGCTKLQLAAGAILAWGRKDVDQRDSGLHARDLIGTQHKDGYWSVEPGKLTTAPLAAFECVENLMAERRGCASHEPGLGDRLLDRVQRLDVHPARTCVAG